MVIPFAAGGPTDVVARILIDPLSARWAASPSYSTTGQALAPRSVPTSSRRLKATSYTLGMIVNSFITNAAILHNQPFDPEKDYPVIAMVVVQPMALVATKSFRPTPFRR